MSVKNIYTIDELAAESDLPVRTVRYYISQGIIDGPEGRGKNASYSMEHLLKLKAARELKEQGVNLGEISRVIPALAEKELKQLVSRSAAQKAREKTAKDMSPKAYLSALLDRSMVTEPVLSESSSLMEKRPARVYGNTSTEWRRYTVKKGIELHVAGDMVYMYGPLIQKILDLTGGKS